MMPGLEMLDCHVLGKNTRDMKWNMFTMTRVLGTLQSSAAILEVRNNISWWPFTFRISRHTADFSLCH